MCSRLFFLLFLAFAPVAMAALDDNVAADINGKILTKQEFERRYKENLQNFKFVPPTKQSILNDIVNFELGVQEAKRIGLEKDPSVQERLSAVLYQALVERTLGEKFNKAVDISDQEARDYCKQNPEIRTSHIYVPLKFVALKADEEAAYKKAREAQAALQKGKKFEEVVAQHSQGYATSAGGDIGFQTRDKLDPTYYKEASRLNLGEVTKSIVRSQYGLHLIKLTGKKSCSEIDIPEFKRMVFDEKRTKIFADFMSSLRSKAKVAINQDAVKE